MGRPSHSLLQPWYSLALCALFFGAEGSGAQVVQPLRLCTHPCPLPTLHPLATLGGADEEGFIGRPSQVLRRPDGSWAVTDMLDPAKVKLFHPDGTWRGNIGQRGSGPGEYRHAMFLRNTPDGGLEVYDQSLLRLTRLDHSYGVAGTRRVDISAAEIAFWEDGRFVANVPGYGTSHKELVLVQPNGSTGRRFGSADASGAPSVHSQWRHIAATQNGEAVWSTHLTRYRLERWSLAGVLDLVLEATFDWFPPGDRYGRPLRAEALSRPPYPGLVGIQQQANGLLWLLIHRPDVRWRDAISQRSRAGGLVTATVHDDAGYMDTVVHVIDPGTATIVGEGIFDDMLLGFAGPGLVYGLRETGPGIPIIHIWALQFGDPHRDPSS